MRSQGVFKVVSRKYKVESPHPEEDKDFEAYVEFDDDILQKVTAVPKSGDKTVLLEIICNDEVCHDSEEINLKDLIGQKQSQRSLNIKEGPV